ncbi:MAG: transposase [Deltaproteobacteria bacterium]|nr:transposase [Deltaproteobacteria bacterium]
MSSKRDTAEFRAEAIRQVTERGYPASEVARRLGVSSYSLYKWLKGVNRTPRLVPQEDLRAENARLKSERKRVEEKREILERPPRTLPRHPGEVRVCGGPSPGSPGS